jgi:hypothetical protein
MRIQKRVRDEELGAVPVILAILAFAMSLLSYFGTI